MVTKTSAIQEFAPLRRRTGALNSNIHTTHTITLNQASGSVMSSESSKHLSTPSDVEPIDTREAKNRQPTTRNDDSGSEYSDGAEGDTDDDDGGVAEGQEKRDHNLSPKYDHPIKSTLEEPIKNGAITPSSRAWYEFDLAVVVALVSPIGNWLTGGDYIKNGFLVILLIFYLHQIIEVPWNLYNNARPRRREPRIPPSTPEERYQQIASSELRALELFFLALSAASPILGAIFLQYATAAVIGEDSVSWFSTALFVLATGMRPWSHVVERFKQRTTDLHDVIHYPSPNVAAEDSRVQIAEMLKRVEHLERALTKAKSRLLDTAEEVYEYVDEAVNTLDRTVKKQEKKFEKHEAKVDEIEHVLEGLRGKGKQRVGLTISTVPKPPASLLTSMLPTWLFTYQSQRKLPTSPYSPSSKHSLRSFPSSSSIQLETIPEEEAAKYPVLAQPANFTSFALSRVGYFATLPVRAVIRMVLRRY